MAGGKKHPVPHKRVRTDRSTRHKVSGAKTFKKLAASSLSTARRSTNPNVFGVGPSAIGGAIAGGTAAGMLLGPLGAVGGFLAGAAAGNLLDSDTRRKARQKDKLHSKATT